MSALVSYPEATAAAGAKHAANMADLVHVALTSGPEAVADLVWHKGHLLTHAQIAG